MAGSPKKRARREARKLAEQQVAGEGALPLTAAEPPAAREEISPPPAALTEKPEAQATAADGGMMPAPPAPMLPAPLVPEVLPAIDAEPTRTSLRRAFRRKAEQYAEEALDRLVTGMRNPDDRVGVPAAREILDRTHGKPTPEIEVGDGGLQVVILKFGGDPQ